MKKPDDDTDRGGDVTWTVVAAEVRRIRHAELGSDDVCVRPDTRDDIEEN